MISYIVKFFLNYPCKAEPKAFHLKVVPKFYYPRFTHVLEKNLSTNLCGFLKKKTTNLRFSGLKEKIHIGELLTLQTHHLHLLKNKTALQQPAHFQFHSQIVQSLDSLQHCGQRPRRTLLES